MIYGKEFEERKYKANEICKKLFKKEEISLIKTLYNAINLKEDQVGDNLQQRLKSTQYSSLSTQELIKNFRKIRFSYMTNKDMELLFQEIHNRECRKNNVEPRYIVSVKDKLNDKSNGYIVPGSNELNINGAMIKRYNAYNSASNYGKNANTIGAHSLFTLIHETQHTCQMEGIMNFALNREKTKEERGRDAIFFLNMAVSQYAEDKHEKVLEDYIKKNYWYDYMEHHSNMAPVKFMKDAIKNGYIDDPVFLDAITFRTTNDIHIREQSTEKRILEMEKVIKKYLLIFDVKFKDGPLKKQLVSVLEDYTKVDKHGHSPLRDSLRKDFEDAKEMIKYCQNNSRNITRINPMVRDEESLNIKI